MGLAEPMAKDAKGKESSDQALIRDLAGLLEETGLSEIEIEREGMRVRVARQVNVAAARVTRRPRLPRARGGSARSRAARAAADPGKHPGAVPSPMVGTAYLAPEPGAAPFVEVGTRVTAGPDASSSSKP